MKAKEIAQTDEKIKKIQLVKGEFSPSEASHIITSLIDEKINFHKIQRLQMWEGNHKCKPEELNGRIEELEKEKEITRAFINSMRSLGKNLKIDGILKITVA